VVVQIVFSMFADIKSRCGDDCGLPRLEKSRQKEDCQNLPGIVHGKHVTHENEIRSLSAEPIFQQSSQDL